jgi:Peptidoglycan-binding protein, CsiV
MRTLITCLLICISFATSAVEDTAVDETVQVDVIVFRPLIPGVDANEAILSSLIGPSPDDAIPLESDALCKDQNYCLLPLSASSLKQSYYALSRKEEYDILARYSWNQPLTSRSPVLLPTSRKDELQIEGQMRLVKGNYFYFNSDLFLDSPNLPEALHIKQDVRLKEDQTVFLDNPYMGILLRVHVNKV